MWFAFPLHSFKRLTAPNIFSCHSLKLAEFSFKPSSLFSHSTSHVLQWLISNYGIMTTNLDLKPRGSIIIYPKAPRKCWLQHLQINVSPTVHSLFYNSPPSFNSIMTYHLIFAYISTSFSVLYSPNFAFNSTLQKSHQVIHQKHKFDHVSLLCLKWYFIT